MSRHRSWCFTVNNYTQQDEQQLQGVQSRYLYLIYGREVAPETQTPHLQGYVQMKQSQTLQYMKKHFHSTAHFEVARGNPKQNYDYCSKSQDFYEYGTTPKQGKRSDIALAKQMVQENCTMQAIALETTSFQALRYAETLKKYMEPQRFFDTTVYWFYGPTGSGKTRKAAEMFPDAYWHTGTQWWDGYDAHESVIIDDFRKEQFPLTELLRMFQPFPYQVKVKGGFRQLLAKNIVITTPNFPDEFMYPGEDINQLRRRILLQEFK